jgi:hypothetical protein
MAGCWYFTFSNSKMTPEEIKKIKSICARPSELRTAFYEDLKAAERRILEIQAGGCDHREPDGVTAMWYGQCRICGLMYRR